MRKRAFSLIESIVALSLILVVMIFVFNVFVITRKGIQLSENHANASTLGRSLLDEVRRAGFDKAVTTSGSQVFAGSSDGNAFSQTVNWTRNVQDVDTNKKIVWVVVSWHEASGDKQVVIETVIQK